jgi:hypothetical protein
VSWFLRSMADAVALGTVEPARRSTRRWNGWRGSKVASVENSVAVITRAQATGPAATTITHGDQL